MDNELSSQLINIYLDGNLDWKAAEPDKDLDMLDEVIIEVEPQDAKTLDEVQSFYVTENVMGSITTFIRRRNVEEL